MNLTELEYRLFLIQDRINNLEKTLERMQKQIQAITGHILPKNIDFSIPEEPKH